ncbi:MAG: hypothetical protein IJJ26_13235 [Victivallales bacterium]|nr:hypothetical protein [Victivallales bacterium]
MAMTEMDRRQKSSFSSGVYDRTSMLTDDGLYHHVCCKTSNVEIAKNADGHVENRKTEQITMYATPDGGYFWATTGEYD